MVTRALTAGFEIWAPILLVVVLLTFAASQRPGTLVESIRERCFSAYMSNSAVEKCVGVPLSRQINRHGSVTFRSTQPNDLSDLFDLIFLLKDLCEILPLRPRSFVDTFLLDII